MTEDSYEDILNLPHHVSETHPHATMLQRAAQFSAFDALSGYSEEIEETGRETKSRADMEKFSEEEINRCLQEISDRISESPTISVRFFVPDERKSGGSRQSFLGQVKKLDLTRSLLIFTDGTRLPVSDLLQIEIMK